MFDVTMAAVRGRRVAALVLVLVVASACRGSGETTTSSTADAGPGSTTTVASTTTAPVSTTSTATSPTSVASTTTTTSAPTTTTTRPLPIPADELELVAFPVPAGSRPHDVAPAPDGGVWYTAQGSGDLGWLDPQTGETRHIDLGPGSRPHGVIVGPGGLAWITDGGRNALQSYDPVTDTLTEYPLPADRSDANLNTAAFDGGGLLWFTGQNGIVGVLDPATAEMEVFDAPRGRGPYGIAATPTGTIYFASLAGSYVGVVGADRSITVLEPPIPDQGARRVWSDSAGAIWVSEWNSGRLSRYEPATETWTGWPLPGPDASAYAIYVDDTDIVWVSDFGGNAIHRFDPVDESFTTFALPSRPGNVRQLLGRPDEVWGAESAADQLIVIRRARG